MYTENNYIFRSSIYQNIANTHNIAVVQFIHEPLKQFPSKTFCVQFLGDMRELPPVISPPFPLRGFLLRKGKGGGGNSLEGNPPGDQMWFLLCGQKFE